MNPTTALALLLLISVVCCIAFAHPIHNGASADGIKLLLLPSPSMDDIPWNAKVTDGANKHFAYSPRHRGGGEAEALFFRTTKASSSDAFPLPHSSFAFLNNGALESHRFARVVADGAKEVDKAGASKFAFAKRGITDGTEIRWADKSGAQGEQLFAVEPIEWRPSSNEFAKRGNFA